jgi:hypothetical protein
VKRKTLTINGKRLKKQKPSDLFRLSVTFDVVTEESAAHGDYADSGFEVEPHAASLSCVIDTLKEYYCFENYHKCDHVSLYCSNSTEDYRTGDSTYYAVHIDGSSRAMKHFHSMIQSMVDEGKLNIHGIKPRKVD